MEFQNNKAMSGLIYFMEGNTLPDNEELSRQFNQLYQARKEAFGLVGEFPHPKELPELTVNQKALQEHYTQNRFNSVCPVKPEFVSMHTFTFDGRRKIRDRFAGFYPSSKIAPNLRLTRLTLEIIAMPGYLL